MNPRKIIKFGRKTVLNPEKKDFRLGWAFVMLIIVISIMSLSMGVQAKEVSQVSEKDLLVHLVEVNLLEKNLENAKKYLDQIYKEEGDSSFTALSAARVHMLYGNYQEAFFLYQKAELLNTDNTMVISQEEKDFIQKLKNGDQVAPNRAYENLSTIAYLNEIGQNPEDYGYTIGSLTKEEIEDQVKSLVNAITLSVNQSLENNKNSISGDVMKEALQLANTIIKEYSNYVSGANMDEQTLKEAIKDLTKIYKRSNGLFRAEELNDALIKGLTFLGKYDDLVQYAEESNDPYAISMVANLYTSGAITKNEFSESFIVISKEQYDTVLEQCKTVIEKINKSKMDILIKDELETIVDKLETQKSNPILAELDRRLKPEETDMEEQSKLYLQKTNVKYELGDVEKADTMLQNALDTAIHNDDSNFVKPMQELINIINDTAEKDEIKNATVYLNEAFEQSLPAKPKETMLSPEKFIQKASEYISTKKAMINIGFVDTSEFPTISVNAQFSSPIDATNHKLELLDCDYIISNFTIERFKYDKLKVYLVCDISGSMSGSEEELQEAVRQYMTNISINEQVALLGFSDGVNFDSGFVKNAKELDSYIERLNPGGGTDIGNATRHSIDQFQQDNKTANIIILMTDGNDNSFKQQSQLNELSQRCAEKNIILYTIGLGSGVSAEYLADIAAYGNGQFVYSNDAISLQSLYEFIHRQIDNNYRITYQAKNLKDNARKLKLSNQKDESEGTKTYYLREADAEDNDKTNNANNSSSYDTDTTPKAQDIKNGVVVNGIENSVIYKSAKVGSNFNLIGKGFINVKDMNVNLEGTSKYPGLKATVTNDGKIDVQIGSNVSYGIYTVVVTLDGQVFRFKDGLKIEKPTSQTTFKFGAYTFTAQTITTSGNQITMSGSVVMNGYIQFKGNIILEGEMNSTQLRLIDKEGAIVDVKQPLPGLLKTFYSNGITLPPLGSFTIYDDQTHIYDLDNYMTEQLRVPNLSYTALVFENPYISIYPHMIKLSLGSLNFEFPFQEEIMEYSKVKNPFTVQGSTYAVITSEKVAAIGSFSATKSEAIKFTVIPFHLSELSFDFNTLTYNFDLSMMVSTKSLIPKKLQNKEVDEAGYGFDIGFKGGKWDSLNLHADFPIMVVATPPVTLSNFMIGVSDLKDVVQGKDFAKSLLNITLTGQTDISLLKLKDIIKNLGTVFGDVSLMTLEETTASIRLRNFKLEFSTKLMLFGALDVGSVQMNIGHYDYSNYLLGIEEDETSGVQVISSRGFNWDQSNIKINVNGKTNVSINDKFTGVWANGNATYDIKLWKSYKNTIDGNVLAGLHNEGKQFSLIIRSTNLKTNKDDGVKLTISDGKLLPKVSFY